MEKIKRVISHGHRKSADATRDRHDSPTTAEPSRTTGTESEGYHPIYDQFTGNTQPSISGQPIQTTAHAPHFSNTTNVHQNMPSSTGATGPSVPQSATSPTSSLRADAAHVRTGYHGEDISTASIKSGVIGFPQGTSDSHAAMGNDNPAKQRLAGNQIVRGGDPSRAEAGESTESSHRGIDAAMGTGAARAGGRVAYEPNRRPEDNTYNNTHTAEQQPLERSLQEPTVTTITDRSFPLAGGVTSRRPAEKTTTSEREPGTKDKEVGVHDGHGREALAGAAAAATSSSALSRPEQNREADSNPYEARTGDSYHPGALAAATVAASTTRPVPPVDQEHQHEGHNHTFTGDPCVSEDKPFTSTQPHSELLFTSEPHATDTANRLDSHLHIPGEFPSPTPVEEPSEPSYIQSKGTTSAVPGAATGVTTDAQHELRHTGTLDQPETRSIDQPAKPTSEHHYGGDAATGEAFGAAGVGAYEAGKHHEKGSTEIGGEIFPTEASPYSSIKLDPRVDAKSAGFEEQKFDPMTSQRHHGRNVALTGGLAQHEVTKPRGAQDTIPPSVQAQPSQTTPLTQDDKPQHHYGRDAALAGAGAATGGGLYHSRQDSNKAQTRPASSTIGPHKGNIANVLDPGVQPDPALQKHHHAGPKPEDPASATVGPHRSNIANIMDPRVLPDPEKQKGHTTTGPHKSDTLNRLDPRVDHNAHAQEQLHHYGRDAAVVGGAGAAGDGAYEAAKSYGEHPSTQPEASMNEQRYDPTAPGAHDPSLATTHQTEGPNKSQHHYGRDAAVVGGLGAAGARAYPSSRGHQHPQQYPMSQQHYPSAQSTHYHPNQTGQQPPVAQAYQQPTTVAHRRYDSVQDPNNQHQKRDAAALGAAGAGGAYAYSQHDAEKERQAQQKALEQQLKEQQKEFEKKQKEQEKAFHAQQRDIEKQQAKEKKHHNKLVAAEEKKHQQEMEKEQKQQEREAEKEEEGKKKHHLFGFLHRDKKDKEGKSVESSPRESRESPRHSKEYAGAGTAGGVAGGAAAYEATHGSDTDSEGRKGRNKLHKDPPPGHPAREAMEHQPQQGAMEKPQYMGIDGAIGDPYQVSGDHETRAGVYGAHPIDAQRHTATEPHTGLRMDTEQYGNGYGGIDGSKTLEGYHQAPQQPGQTAQQGLTDWEAISKANAPS